jgi:hypothetical protein
MGPDLAAPLPLRHLILPPDTDPEDDEVAEAFEAQDPSGEGWRRCGIEAHSCAALLRACDASLATGAAIVFC